MKGKLVKEILVSLGIFAAIWLFFAYFPVLFPDEDTPIFSVESEEQLGDLMLEHLLDPTTGYPKLENPVVDSAIEIIATRLLDSIGLTDYDYHLHVVESDQVNAFTIPGGNILILSGLLDFAESPEEVAAVLAHEIGHVEHRHVVQNLIKEFTLAIIFAVLTGGDAIMLQELSKTVLSTAFSRKAEEQADTYALDLMIKCGMRPSALASFFRRLSREKGSYTEELEVFMTHPHNNARIKKAMTVELPDGFVEKALPLDWKKVKEAI